MKASGILGLVQRRAVLTRGWEVLRQLPAMVGRGSERLQGSGAIDPEGLWKSHAQAQGFFAKAGEVLDRRVAPSDPCFWKISLAGMQRRPAEVEEIRQVVTRQGPALRWGQT